MPKKEKEEEKVKKLINSSDISLKDGDYEKAKDSLKKAKSICEDQPNSGPIVAGINRKIGDVSKAQRAATRRISSNFSSINTVSERMSKPSTSRLSAHERMSKPSTSRSSAHERMSKPSTSRSSAHDGSVNDEVFVNSASFLKQLDESNRASDACQESRRRSSLGSASDTLIVCNAFDAILKNKGYSIDRDVLSNRLTGLIQEVRKSRSQSESRLPGKTDNKPEARFSYSINDSANEKVTKTSLKHGSCLDNTSTGTGLSTPVSKPRHRRGSTFVISSPNPNSQFTNGSQSDCNSPSTDMDSVQQPKKCDISLSREGGK